MSPAMIIPGMSGPFEILLILFVILLLFGAKRLPELARSLGRSMGEFKKGRQEGEASQKELKQGKQKDSLPRESEEGKE